MSVFYFLLAENGHFRPFLTPPKIAHKNGSKFFDAFLPNPLILTHFPQTLLEKKKKIGRNASKNKNCEKCVKKWKFFFMGCFRGGQKWPQPANKKSKTDICEGIKKYRTLTNEKEMYPDYYYLLTQLNV